MINKKISLFVSFFFMLSSLATADDMFDESLEDLMGMESELKADVGSRGGSASTLFSSTPIDVITYTQIKSSGLTSLTDVLRYFVAGFNAPDASSLNDGSSFVRAWTLRGMSPDQVLVLVNGKRLHTTSLVHLNNALGRGTSSVDLDTISVIAIEKIEILRDGAAAQYGSDAIAGVINIKLKGAEHENSISIQAGTRSDGDGEELSANVFLSTPLKYDGFVNFTLNAKDQQKTDNSGVDSRTGVAPPRHTTAVGIPEARNYLATLNMEAPQDNDVILYFDALGNSRDATANAYYRAPTNDSATPSNGFLPMINGKILDVSATAGARGKIRDMFSWDISNTYGYNQIDLHVNDTMNYSIENSPTSFDNGGLRFTQNTTNLDLAKSMGDFSLAGGAEYRYENYEIVAGEANSYYQKSTYKGGTQGLGGYENSIDESRTNYALYLDTKYKGITDLTIGAAARYENFSDFGDTTNFKLDLGYKVTPKLLIRTSGSTGFRAPSLAQSNYTYVSSYSGSSGIEQKALLSPNDPLAQSLGAEALKPETSTHFALGSAYEIDDDISLSIDYFYIAVEDKIMLSPWLDVTGADFTQASFFTNAVNTTTQGVDIKLNSKYTFKNNSKLNSSVWYNYSSTEVRNFNTNTITAENSIRSINEIENGQPKSSLKVLNIYKYSAFTAALNLSWYDSYKDVRENSLGTPTKYTFDSMLITDLDIAYAVTKKITIALGGNNIFNKRANRWDGLNGTTYGSNGIVPYSYYSPAGLSGAYYYARASLEF